MTGRLTLTPIPGEVDYCTGPQGCGKCWECKRQKARALARKIDADRPYLGPGPTYCGRAPRWMTTAYYNGQPMTQGWVGGAGPKYGAYDAYSQIMTEPIGGWELYEKAYPNGREF